MPNIPEIQIGNATYKLKDAEARDKILRIGTKTVVNDVLETTLMAGIYPLDETGVTTEGKAWRANKGEVVGSNYMYITYQVPGSYAGNVAIIYGHGWGEPYPLVCFYDSNMDFITSSGLRGDTDYKGLPCIIPTGTSTIVINGRIPSPYTVGIAFYSLMDFVGATKKVSTYSRIINSTLLSQVPELADARDWPTNCVYSLAHDVYPLISNLPPELHYYATILKINGVHGASASSRKPYNLYLCANEQGFWIGFETNDALYWRMISGEAVSEPKYLLIGDSYGDGYSHDGNNSGWCTYFVEEMGLSSSKYEKRHQGGSGFANGGFLDRLNSATGNGFTDIIVLGGFNDNGWSEANIDNGIQTFCSRAKTLYPSAKVHIGCVGWIKQGTGESAYQNWQEVRNNITNKVLPIYQRCAKYGAEYINFSEYILTDSMMTNTDGYHPGENGNKAIAHGITTAISTGNACLPFRIGFKSL